jgi:cellulose synthase/poly-beta-1,6-N-acetylglucosamine synthase-like glycosyltransferase
MAHNEEMLIRNCINKVLLQEIKGGKIVEIIVVSSGSVDDTNKIVNEISEIDSRVKLIVQEERLGKASAINEYLKAAQGDILILESADTYTDSDSISQLIKPFSDEKTGMVGAHPVPVNNVNTFIGYCVHKLWNLHHLMASDSPKCGEMIAFRNLITRIPHYTAVDEAAIESIFCHHGFKLIYAPKAIVHNKGPESLHDFFKQRRRIASGHRHLMASTGHEVPTHSSRKIITYLLKDQKWNPKNILYTIMLIGIEAISRMTGFIDYYMRDKNPFIWDISKSTKHIS